MTARSSKGQDPVEAAVERAETAEEKAEAARQRAEALAAERVAKDQALLAKAQGEPAGIEAQTTTGAAAVTDPRNTAGLVPITLAHPLPADALRRVNVPAEQDYEIGDTIQVRPEVARSLIGAGYAAGVHPDRPAEVAAALAAR